MRPLVALTRIPIVAIAIAAVAAIVLAAGPSHARVASGFDTGLEGWLITGDNDFQWQPSGGNPDGYLDVNDLATGAYNYAVAPPKFLGDWSAFSAADTLSADIWLWNTSGGAYDPGAYVFRIAGPGGAAHAIDPVVYVPPQQTWTTYRIPFDESQWTIEAGTWPEILARVTSLRVIGEFIYGDEEVGIDNVILTRTPGPGYIACAQSDFNGTDTEDWTFENTGGVTNPGSGGNGGGYASITDGTGNSYALAPAMFWGDWSALDGSGRVTIDLRIVSRSGTNEGAPEFIRLTGPGGSAHVSLAAADLPASNLVWKTFSYPLSSSVWTLDSGTWSGLLADVEEVRIDLEFFTSTEKVGFDNFGRLEAGCPPIDDTVVVRDPALALCGWESFVGIYGVALNPLDGGLYGIVRATTSAGGGLYPVTGTGAGVRLQAYDRPAHLIFDSDGDAFVSEDYDGYIYRRAADGTASLWVSGFHSGDDDPVGMTFAPPGFNGPNVTEGDILVTDHGASGPDEIWSFSPDVAEGELQVYHSAVSVEQYDLAGAPNDTVYVCDAFNASRLYTLTAQGVLGSFSLSAPVDSIYSIVYDEVEDALYVSSMAADAVYRVNPHTGEVTLVADGFANLTPGCLEIDNARGRLWVADAGYNRVCEICLERALSVAGAQPPAAVSPGLEILPNPFSRATEIRWRRAERGRAEVVTIHDVTGRLVRRLQAAPGGSTGAVRWDGKDEAGRAVAPGAYLVRVEAGEGVSTGRVLLVR